jgi:hypothetical protein
MPFYDFMNQETGEVQQIMLSISKLDEFKEQNPHLKLLITGAPSMISGTNHHKKMDNGWKENLARIAEAHPNSALAERQGGRSTTKAKVEEIAKKHGRLKNGQYKMDGL